MGYITTERVAEIRSELKATFPDFTFRCYREHSSTVNVVIVSAPIQFLSHEQQAKGYVQANHYGGFKSQFGHCPEAVEALDKIQAIITKGQTHYETGDYGMQPSFYEHIYIGEYNKPFVLTQTPAPGNPLTVATGATIRLNEAKGGIEICFAAKPAESVIASIKADGFRWSRFNKVWYIRDSSYNRVKAGKYGTLPEASESNEGEGTDANVLFEEARYKQEILKTNL